MDKFTTLETIESKNKVRFCFKKIGNNPKYRISYSEYLNEVSKFKDYATILRKDDTEVKFIKYLTNGDFYINYDVNNRIYSLNLYSNYKIHKVLFQVIDNRLYHSCNCEKGIKFEICWHVKNMLSGRFEKLIDVQLNDLDELILKAERTDLGKALIYYNHLNNYKKFRNMIP